MLIWVRLGMRVYCIGIPGVGDAASQSRYTDGTVPDW